MTAFDRTDTIAQGDWVIIFHSRTQLTSEIVTRDKDIQSRFGYFRHNDFVGKPWGTKLASSNGRGFVYLLKPTPELWTQALPHRTQILYLPDIAFITSYLDIKPGSRVIEAGTGSGSFSHSLARTVGKEGKVHSFEYHEERFAKARDEFKEHKLDEVIQVKHQNVYKDGFELEDEVDSVFLDLPAPWEALEHAKKAMRKDRQSRICCFSPCIEQVIRTCSALSAQGFSSITMYETLTRTHDPVPLTAPSVDEAVKRIEAVERKKERRREGQIEEARKRREEKKRKRDEEERGVAGGAGAAAGAVDGDGGDDALAAKKARLDGAPGGDGATTATADADADAPMATAPSAPATAPTSAASSPAPTPTHRPRSRLEREQDRDMTVKAGPYARGHTSYLTFAVLLPLVQGDEAEATAGGDAAKEVPVEVAVPVSEAGADADADAEAPVA
ncbi:tRNA methyltransferase complex subunit Cpd1 [Rhodotorula diobovata]|uniref:tRNA (adenine(58)-N(1))-methyltransferase catalytic subunit TRM61 n=1 Tax=Rhodotorula diobovata TaxID=5288 RepID=A0A5C5FZC1_9BASI|nr:tRNA methyltransferase complex subunit Cpd1 [Rhodotorula diobovata]